MREIEYKEENFKEVLRLHKVCETSERKQQIHFNDIKQVFEYYSPDEYKDIPNDQIFDHPQNAIDRFLANKEQIANAVSEADTYRLTEEPSDDYTLEASMSGDIEDLEPLEEIDATEREQAEPVFENDDPEVLAATTSNLKVLRDVQQKLQTESRERLSRIIADIYKCDIISESDVAKSLVENNEFKKLLSMLFGMLNVTVSSTKVSLSLEVSSGSLSFNPRIEYGLEDYRRGAAQCLADVRQLRESGDKIKALEETIREQNHALASVRKELSAAETKYNELQTQRAHKKEQNLLQPVEHVISWNKDGAPRYLLVSSKAKLGEDGSYPTKYLGKTSKREKATIFTEEQAKLQVARLVKHRQNLTFVELKDAGNKEASEFFSIYRTTVEKV